MIPGHSGLLPPLPLKNDYQSWGNDQTLVNIQADPSHKNSTLIFNAKNTESFSARENSLNFIYITNPPQQGSLLGELFGKAYKALKDGGRLCFIVFKIIDGENKKVDEVLRGVSPLVVNFETIIYYGMGNGFLFLDNWTKRSFSSKRHLYYTWFLKINSIDTIS